MTLTEFRNDKSLVEQWADELATNKLLQIVLDVLETEHPARFALAGDNNGDISPTRAGLELGLTRGYSLYGDKLKLAAKLLRESEGPPETEYLPPEPEEASPKSKRKK